MSIKEAIVYRIAYDNEFLYTLFFISFVLLFTVIFGSICIFGED